MVIRCDFPGGNIVVERIGDEVVELHQDLRDTEGDWFYWCFEAAAAPGQQVEFRFTRSEAIGVRGPAISEDGGGTWRWLGVEATRGNGFQYTFPASGQAVRFGMTIPYTERDWNEFADRSGIESKLVKTLLCRSRAGREVWAYHTPREDDRRLRLLLTCRHHACETMGSFVLEGFISAAIAPGWLRDHAAFYFVPFMDRDGVENGDQGKNRRPRDHNRDYDGDGLYPETRALRQAIPEWSRGRLDMALDLHCPWLKDGWNERAYFVGSPHALSAQHQQMALERLQVQARGPVRFGHDALLPFGTDWNVAANYAAGKSFTMWAAELPEMRLAMAIEIPYANASEIEVNPDSARALGADLAGCLSSE